MRKNVYSISGKFGQILKIYLNNNENNHNIICLYINYRKLAFEKRITIAIHDASFFEKINLEFI